MSHDHPRSAAGFTLIEVLIAMAIFSILLTILYPTFDSVSKNTGEIGDKEEMMQKGQRVLDYMAEELRLAGLFVGPRPSIYFCSSVNTIDTIMHSEQTSSAQVYSDQVSFLTSERVRTSVANKPFLQVTSNVLQGSSVIPVNAPGSDTTVATSIKQANGSTANGHSFITFDTLKPSPQQTLVYQVLGYSGGNISSITPTIQQPIINTYSNIYSVVRYQFGVDASRNLNLVKWNEDCTTKTTPLLQSLGAAAGGGVDGFQDSLNKVVPVQPYAGQPNPVGLDASNIQNVRAITIWLLVRADFKANGFINTNTYTLGSAYPVTIPAFNDGYRRMLLTKSVEVKNVGL
jgi:prepilin-type N-terminal cleavage/methylation domain-containing protein